MPVKRRTSRWHSVSQHGIIKNARENIIVSILLSLPGFILIILCPALFCTDGLRVCGGH